MKHFAVFKQNSVLVKSDLSLSGVAVDDCATECVMEELFDCQSFQYCAGEGLCLLSRVHPDLNQSLVQPHKFCDLYTSRSLSRVGWYTYYVMIDRLSVVFTSRSRWFCSKAIFQKQIQ